MRPRCYIAAIAFLYIVNEAIPKLSYLTAIDTMILSCFFNLFLGIAVSFGVYWLNRKGREGYENIAFIVNEIGCEWFKGPIFFGFPIPVYTAIRRQHISVLYHEKLPLAQRCKKGLLPLV